jgi:hypothetical protein
MARLAPGFCAAATHGVIRVGHAVRSLAAADTPGRVRELADALASWAATYQELPASRDVANGTMTPREAIARIPVIPPANRRDLGDITASLAMLDDFPDGPVIAVDRRRSRLRPPRNLQKYSLRVHLANAHNLLTTIVFIHGVTSLAALGSIIPEVARSDGPHEVTLRVAVRVRALCVLWRRQPWPRTSRHANTTRMIWSIAPSPMATAMSSNLPKPACRHALGPSPAYFAAVDSALAIMPSR